MLFNYEVSPGVVEPFLPRGTEVDFWNGRTFVSVVAFRFLDTRFLGFAIPFHRNFEEVNLRFYVRRLHRDGPRRAVVFVREMVPRRAVAMVARATFNEPYLALPMRSAVSTEPPLTVSYQWRYGGRWQGCEAAASGPLVLPEPGSLDQFIAEHYWGYTRQRDGGTVEYEVTHSPWAVAPAASYRIDADVEALYGLPFGPLLKNPVSVFLADGSPVGVSRPAKLQGDQP